jgi:hypothetical protein
MSSKAGRLSSVSDSLEDLTVDNLTAHAISPLVKYLITKLIQYLHDFVRDVQLQTDEFEAAWQFLTKVLFSSLFPTSPLPRPSLYLPYRRD